MNSYQKAVLSVEESTPHPHSRPDCFNSLLLWQSSGICLQSSKTAVCEAGKLTTPHTACPLIGSLLYWKHINDVDMTTTGAKHYKIILKGNTWQNKLPDICLHGQWKDLKLQRDHRGKKAEIHYLRCICFTLWEILVWSLLCWFNRGLQCYDVGLGCSAPQVVLIL